MTRIFTDGAEMQDILFWSPGISGYASLAVSSSNPASSPYHYQMQNTSGAGGALSKDITGISEGYFRQRVRQNSASTTSRYPSFIYGSTYLLWLAVDANQHFCAYSANGLLEDSGYIWNTSQWYLVEIYIKIADAPDGRFVVYVDGVKRIDFTGDTKPDANTTFNVIQYYNQNYDHYIKIDDLALNDTNNANGLNDNSWCGDGIVVKLTPDEDGAHNNWHGSDTNDVDNYLLVDDFPKDDDTTYVYHDASGTGVQDQYSLSDTDFTDKTILRIYPEARALKTTADAATLKLGILASGGTDDMSAGKSLTLAYEIIVGDDEKVNPVDTFAWEDADLDALELVIEVG